MLCHFFTRKKLILNVVSFFPSALLMYFLRMMVDRSVRFKRFKTIFSHVRCTIFTQCGVVEIALFCKSKISILRATKYFAQYPQPLLNSKWPSKFNELALQKTPKTLFEILEIPKTLKMSR